MRFRRVAGSLGLAALVTVSGSLRAKEAADTGQTQPIIATGGVVSSLLATPVVGEPFSAVQVHETTRTLADGATISHKGHHSIARDADGRVHVELRMANGENGKPDEVMVFVMDPVAHTLTTWVANGPNQVKTASFFKLPSRGLHPATQPSQQQTASESSRPQPIVTVQDLGTQSIDGLEATGKRTTTIVPAGLSGNSAPITKIHEVWTSHDLQLVIKQHWSDPRTGERTVELEKIARSNPDPTLFRAPAGYEVKSASETLKQLEEKLDAAGQ
jgi:hypothetical protein